jgi:hypothetical protein
VVAEVVLILQLQFLVDPEAVVELVVAVLFQVLQVTHHLLVHLKEIVVVRVVWLHQEPIKKVVVAVELQQQDKRLKDLAQVVMEEQVVQVQLMEHQLQEQVVEVVWDLHTSLVLEEVDPLEEEMVE